MNKQQQAVLDALIATMEANLKVDFSKLNEDAPIARESAVITAIEQYQRLVQQQLEEIAAIVKMKLPYIRELQQIGEILESRLAEFRKEGERTPVPTETRSPNKNKAN